MDSDTTEREMETSDKIERESSEIDSDTTEREMETSDKMVEDSETNPDLTETLKGISKTKEIERDSIASESDSDSEEETRNEILKFQVYKFFEDNPETEEEKDMKKSQIQEQVKMQHKKCRELLELALGNTKVFKLMKKISLHFSKELRINHTFQEITNEAESLMLEYGMCVDTDSLRRDLEDLDLEAENHLEIALQELNKISYADINLETPADFRSIEECVRDLLMVHLIAAGDEEQVRKRIKVQALALEDSKSKGKVDEKEMSGSDAEEETMPSNMEISDTEDSNEKKSKKETRHRRRYYRVYMDEEILNHRINFLKALQDMIRSSLRLFRRLNKAWIKPGETLIERTLEQVKQQMEERRDKIDKRYFWDDWRDDFKGGDKEIFLPNATCSYKEPMPADDKGASNRKPLTRKDFKEILAAEGCWQETMKALHNAARTVLSSESFRATLAATSVPVPGVAVGSVPVPGVAVGSVSIPGVAVSKSVDDVS